MDTSATGLGVVLAQKDDDNKERVICYASRSTRGAEVNYAATQLECLAVVWACKHFKYYILGIDFEVITDHVSLQWLFDQKDPSGLFARWIMALQPFGIEQKVKYRRGKQHQNADTLSRTPKRPSTVKIRELPSPRK